MQVKEATKCTASVGIGPNMLLAKLATSTAKPDGVFRINPGGDTDRFGSLPVVAAVILSRADQHISGVDSKLNSLHHGNCLHAT